MRYILLILLFFSCAKENKEEKEIKILEKTSNEDVIHMTLDNSTINNNLAIKFDNISSQTEQKKTIKIFNKKQENVLFDINYIVSQSNGKISVDRDLTSCDVLKYNEVCFLTLKSNFNINDDYNLPEVLRFNRQTNNDVGVIGILFDNLIKPKFLLKKKNMEFSYVDNIFIVENFIINNNESNLIAPNIIAPPPFTVVDNNCNIGGVQATLKPNGLCSFKISLNVDEEDFMADTYNVNFESNGSLINEDLFLDVRFKRNLSFKTEIILSHNELKRIYIYNNSGIDQVMPSTSIDTFGLKTVDSNCSTVLNNGFGCFFDVKFDSSTGYIRNDINFGGTIMTIHAGLVNQCTSNDLSENKATSTSIVVTGVKVGNSTANCKIVSCDNNHDVANNSCIPKSCTFENASNVGIDLNYVTSLAGNVFSCQVSSCEFGYQPSFNRSSCNPILCDMSNAVSYGVNMNNVKKVSGEALSCEVSECLSGYSIGENRKECTETPCTLENAFNYGVNMSKVTSIVGGINSCEVGSCDFGYDISLNKKSCVETPCTLENATLFGVNTSNVLSVLGTSSNCSVSSCAVNYQINIIGKSCEPKKCDFTNSFVNNVDVTNVLTLKNDVFNCEVNSCKSGYLKANDNKSCYETPCTFDNATTSGVITDNALSLRGGIFSCEIESCKFGYTQNSTNKRCNEIPCSLTNATTYGVDLTDVLSVQGSALNCQVTSCSTIEKKVSNDKKSCELIPCTAVNAPENGINLFQVDTTTLSGGVLSCQVNSCLFNLYEVSEDKKSCIPKKCTLSDASEYGVDISNVESVSGTVFECRIEQCQFGYLKNETSKSCYPEMCDSINASKYGVNLQYSTGVKAGTTGLNCELNGCDSGYQLSLDKKNCEEIVCNADNAPSNINVNNVLEFEGSFVNCAIKTCEYGYKKSDDSSSCELVECSISNASYFGISLENILEVEVDQDPAVRCKIKECMSGSTISSDLKSCVENLCVMSDLPSDILTQELVTSVQGTYSNCLVSECQLGYKPSQNKKSCEQAYCYENPELYGIVNDDDMATLISIEAPYCEVISCITQVSNVEEVIADPINVMPIFNSIYYYEPVSINGAVMENGTPRKNSCAPVPCTFDRATIFGINTNKVISLNGQEADNCKVQSCENGYTPAPDGLSCIPEVVRTPEIGEYYSLSGGIYAVGVGETGVSTGAAGISLWYWAGVVVGTTSKESTTLSVGSNTYYRGNYNDTFYGDPHYGIYKIQIGN